MQKKLNKLEQINLFTGLTESQERFLTGELSPLFASKSNLHRVKPKANDGLNSTKTTEGRQKPSYQQFKKMLGKH